MSPETLYEELLKIEKDKRRNKEITITLDQIEEFLEEEMQLRAHEVDEAV